MWQSFLSGFGRSSGRPLLILGLWLVNLLVALPLTVLVASEISGFLGDSTMDEALLEGFDAEWHGEFQTSAGPLGKTATAERLSPAALFDNIEAVWSGEIFGAEPAVLLAAGLTYALLWSFLLGGTLERLASAGEGRRFSVGCADHGPKILLLALISAPFYGLVYRLAGWFFPLLEDWTLEWASEPSVFALAALAGLLLAGLLALVHLVFTYAKASLVLEGHSSVFSALGDGLKVLATRPLAAFGLYILYAFVAGLAVIGWWLWGPGPGQTNQSTIFVAFLVGQLYLLLRLYLRLAFYGAHLAFYEGVAGRGRLLGSRLSG